MMNGPSIRKSIVSSTPVNTAGGLRTAAIESSKGGKSEEDSAKGVLTDIKSAFHGTLTGPEARSGGSHSQNSVATMGKGSFSVINPMFVADAPPPPPPSGGNFSPQRYDGYRPPIVRGVIEAARTGAAARKAPPNSLNREGSINAENLAATESSAESGGSTGISSKSTSELKEMRQDVVLEYKTLIQTAISDRSPIKLPEPAGADGKWELRTGPLSTEQKTEVLKAMNECNNDWGTLIKKYGSEGESGKQMIADVRAFQKEITADLLKAVEGGSKDLLAVGSTANTSDLDYTSTVSKGQSKQVDSMASGFREIFGKESGVVFDTNFYTAHIALEKGFSVNSNEGTKHEWLNQNDVQSKVKQAEHYACFDKPGVAFEETHFYQKVVAPTVAKTEASGGNAAQQLANFKEAFTVARSVVDAVKTKSDEIKKEGFETVRDHPSLKPEKKAELTGLLSKFENADLSGAALKEAKTLIENSSLSSAEKLDLTQLMGKLGDSKCVEMEAKNKLYAVILEKVEAGKMEYDNLGASIKSTIESLPGAPSDIQGLTKTWVQEGCKPESAPEGLPSDVKDTLSDLTQRMQDVGTKTMANQSEGLHYASEPYYAQATVVGVVAGIQMVGGEGAKIFASLVPESVSADMKGVGLDPKQMIGDLLQLGKFSDADTQTLNKMPEANRDLIMAKMSEAKDLAQAQLNKDYPVLDMPETQKFSAQENFGDFVKDFGHYILHPVEHQEHEHPNMKAGAKQKFESDCGDQFVLKGSKYLYRTALCMDMYMTSKDVKMGGTPIQLAFQELKLLSKEMLDIRQGAVSGGKAEIRALTEKFLNSDSVKALGLPAGMIDPTNLGKSLFNVVESMMTKV